MEQVEAQLPAAAASAYRRCVPIQARPIQDLETAVETYLGSLQARDAEAEFLDLATATRVAEGCRALLRQLQEAPSPTHHHAVQAAVDYFVLDDDAEDDGSIVGFDDDLHVLQVTAEVLGWRLPGDDE